MIAKRSGDRVEKLFWFLGILLNDLPRLLFYIGIAGGAAYCVTLMTVGFAMAIWEAIRKKNINDDLKDRIIRIVTICLFIVICVLLFYQKVLK